jgi:hypothetical protein
MHKGVSLDVQIYRGPQEGWSLEVVNQAGTSTVWDDRFDSDDAEPANGLSRCRWGRCIRGRRNSLSSIWSMLVTAKIPALGFLDRSEKTFDPAMSAAGDGRDQCP